LLLRILTYEIDIAYERNICNTGNGNFENSDKIMKYRPFVVIFSYIFMKTWEYFHALCKIVPDSYKSI
jgi:hypothetical protein